MPIGVLALDQVDLPVAMPALQLLFAGDGVGHVVEQLESNEPMHTVVTCKAGHEVFTMLPDTADEVRRDANIKRTPRLAGEDVDGRLTQLHRHRPFLHDGC